MDSVNAGFRRMFYGTVFAPYDEAKDKFTPIDPNTDDPRHKDLLETIHRLCQAAGLTQMPQVAIYQSSLLNAYANGLANRILISSGALTPPL